MKRIHYITMTALAAVSLTACIDESGPCLDSELLLTASIDDGMASTRSSMEQDTAFDTGESVSVFLKDAGGGTVGVMDYNGDKPYTTTAGAVPSGTPNATGSTNGLAFSVTQYWPSNNEGVYVYAWYPVMAATEYGNFTSSTKMTATDLTFTVKADQSTAASYKKSDLMFGTYYSSGSYYDSGVIAACARVTSADRGDWNVPLKFAHLLSRIHVVLTSGTGSPTVTNATVEIGDASATNGCLIDRVSLPSLTAGTATVPASSPHRMATALKLCTKGVAAKTGISGGYRENSAYAIVPPQNVKDKLLVVTLSDGGRLWTRLPDVTLAAGKAYKFSLTVNVTELVLTSVVEAWDSEPTQTGKAEFYIGES